MRTAITSSLAVVLLALPCLAAIGDNAPSIPSTYLQVHPHLPHPDSTYLAKVCNNGASGGTTSPNDGCSMNPTIRAGAEGWNASQGFYYMRTLLIAYAASKNNGTPNATYFHAIEALSPATGCTITQAGTAGSSTWWYEWVAVLADGTATVAGSTCTTGTGNSTLSGSNYNVVSTTAISSAVSYKAYRTYTTGTSPTTLGLVYSGTSTTFNDTGLTADGSTPPLAWGSTLIEGWALAMAYDWEYADLGATLQGSFRAAMYSLMSGATGECGAGGNESDFFISGATQDSPWADTNYTRVCAPELQMALAIYPDDAANSLPHLRWALDYFLNMQMPAFRHTIAGNRCGLSTDSSNDCGGAWIEGWSDYEGKVDAMTAYIITDSLSWATASGIGVNAWFNTINPWLKNLGYWMIYSIHPDFTIVPNVDESFNELGAEAGYGDTPGYLNETAAIYNDPTMREWSRMVNNAGAAPDGFTPSAYPWYTPDSSANTVNTLFGNGVTTLSPYKNFPGMGMLAMRTGWGEGDTTCTITYGDSFWDHTRGNVGAFECYHRGWLAIIGGDYRSGSGSPHWMNYGASTVAHNDILLCDSADAYGPAQTGSANNSEYYEVLRNYNTGTYYNAVNDCGQRRIGSIGGLLYQGTSDGGTSFNLVGNMSSVLFQPVDEAMWDRSREYYHQGQLLAWATGSSNKYAFAAMDITAAYNNTWSHNPYTTPWQAHNANTSNRTYRANKVVRQFLFIPHGTSAYLVVYDQINANPANYANITKKELVHFVNQPVIGTPSGGSTPFNVSRTETVTSVPFGNYWTSWANWLSDCPSNDCSANGNQYVYNGQLYGYLTWPQASGTTNCATGNFSCITAIGGPGHEFQVTDATTGQTHNWNECQYSQCNGGGISGSATENFTISSTNNAMLLSVDGGANQAITLTTGTRTCAQIIADINAVVNIASCQVDDFLNLNRVALQSPTDTFGSSMGIVSVANNAYATLGLAVGTYSCCYGAGAGATADVIHSNNTLGPQTPGAWRIEETIGTNNKSDQFINLLSFQDAGTNLISTPPTTSVSGSNYVTTWKDNANTCTYTVTQPINGVGGAVTAIGAGCSPVIN